MRPAPQTRPAPGKLRSTCRALASWTRHGRRADGGRGAMPRLSGSPQQRLGLRVQRLARGGLAADGHEARQPELLPCCLDRVGPLLRAAARVDILRVRGGLLGDDLAVLVLLQRAPGEAGLGLLLLTVEDGSPRSLALGDLAHPL